VVLDGLASGALKIRVSGVQFPPWPFSSTVFSSPTVASCLPFDCPFAAAGQEVSLAKAESFPGFDFSFLYHP
jgi:hypothetical protein